VLQQAPCKLRRDEMIEDWPKDDLPAPGRYHAPPLARPSRSGRPSRPRRRRPPQRSPSLLATGKRSRMDRRPDVVAQHPTGAVRYPQIGQGSDAAGTEEAASGERPRVMRIN
jgi:hypothetical protein